MRMMLFGVLAAADGVVDLRPFEREVLPRWVDRFALDFERGAFAFAANDTAPALYGVLDATHLLASVGRLDALGAGVKAAWASAIAGYRRADGSYDAGAGAPGWQPWHAFGTAAAALALLGATPPAPPDLCADLVAAGAGAWRDEMDASLRSRCPKASLGGNDVHKCGQRIGACPAVLGAAASPRSPADAAFLDWWRRWLTAETDPSLGVLCPIADTSAARMQCLGGAMPTHGVLLGFEPGAALPSPRALLDFALALQGPEGAWSDAAPDAISSLSLDGVFQVARAATQLEGAYRWDDARDACRRLTRLAAAQLTNATFVLGNYAATSHDLPNAVAAVAECAQTFPEDVRTDGRWACCARYV